MFWCGCTCCSLAVICFPPCVTLKREQISHIYSALMATYCHLVVLPVRLDTGKWWDMFKILFFPSGSARIIEERGGLGCAVLFRAWATATKQLLGLWWLQCHLCKLRGRRQTDLPHIENSSFVLFLHIPDLLHPTARLTCHFLATSTFCLDYTNLSVKILILGPDPGIVTQQKHC